jgi:DNA polymerase-3 subunit alpha
VAENEPVTRNLLQIASASQLEGYYYFPRVDHEFLAAHSEGLIASTSCMSGEVPRTILNQGAEAGQKLLEWYIDTFGPDHFFIELQSHNIRELPELNRTLIELGKRYNLKFIATNDVHYVIPAMPACRTSCLQSRPARCFRIQPMRMTGKRIICDLPRRWRVCFRIVPSALSNTLDIAERCKLDLIKEGYHLPKFPCQRAILQDLTCVNYAKRD